MDYEKKYKEALERAKNIHKDAIDMGENIRAKQCEVIFPELKDSENERIRKEIISALKYANHKGVYDKHIAWLEKQYQEEEPQVYKTEDGEVITYSESEGYKVAESKFKVGDWIISKYMHLVMQILNNDNGSYKTVETDGTERNDSYDFIERNFKLWTIQDAKDGDVLHSPTHNLIWIHKDIQHYHACMNMNYVKENFSTYGFIVIPIDVCPATKDEQTVLFAKMKEEGYEWDAEKKELKKIKPFDEYEGLTDFERTLADICIGWIGKEIGWKEYIKDNADVLLKIAVEKLNSVQDAPFEQRPVEENKGNLGGISPNSEWTDEFNWCNQKSTS